MDFERAFDNLAFGKSVPKLDACLGLFCAPGVFYVSSVRINQSKPVVEHLLRVPVPQSGPGQKSSDVRTMGSLNTESLADPESLAAALKPALEKFSRHPPHVVVSLSSQFGLLRYFTVPPMDRRFWKTAIPAEARKLIPIPFNELVFDFQVRPIAPSAGQPALLGVLFSVVYRKNLQDLFTLVQKLGLQLLGVELAACSVERLWDSLAPSGQKDLPYAHVHLEGSDGYVLLSQQGWPILSRTVQLTRESTPLERRKVDLSGSVDFAVKQFRAQSPAQIRVSGSNKDLKGWIQALTEEMNAPVSLQEAAKMLGLKAEEWGGYASIGCALRYTAPTAVTLDVSQYGRISDEDKQAVYSLFGIVGVTAAILMIIGGFRYAETLITRNKLNHLRHQVYSVEEFRNRSPDQIQSLVKGLDEKVNAIRMMWSSKASLAELFQIVQEDVPQPVWVENFTYDSPLNDVGQKVLSLKGYAAGSEADAEQSDMVNQFRKSLQEDERFGKMFSCGMPSVRMESEQALLNDDPARKKRDRVAFSLTCSSKNEMRR